MNVEVTAPIPGMRMPNLPSAGAMVEFDLLATGKKNAPEREKKSGGAPE
jgi:hypothetical protein